MPGPGSQFVGRIRKDFPGFRIIAEDLGALSNEAKSLLANSGYPGMKVLQFAFSGNADNPYLPHNITENSVAYTGTHDNNTTAAWAATLPRDQLAFALKYLGLHSRDELPGALLRTVLASTAETAIIPMQDWLGLGAMARMNTPGTMGGRNWKWRMDAQAMSTKLAKKMCEMTEEYYCR